LFRMLSLSGPCPQATHAFSVRDASAMVARLLGTDCRLHPLAV
jgi:hypothetical protein